jgi:hypothetical protein
MSPRLTLLPRLTKEDNLNTDARLNLDMNEVDWSAIDDRQLRLNQPAIIREKCTGPNPRCRRAHAEGKSVHFIPPRVHAWGAHLVMPTYHFATGDDAIAGFEEMRRKAIEAKSFAHRDALYILGAPVWVPFELDR